MALTNAERQRKYRQRRQAELIGAKSLRNEHHELVIEMEKLRNENSKLKQELTQVKAKLSSLSANIPSSVTTPADIPYDERLLPLRIPMQYQRIHAASLDHEEFTRLTPQLWVRSKGISNYKFAYRLMLLQIGNRYLLELRPPLDKKSEEKLQSFITWQEMEDYIKERGL
jgi:hypothetical protein